MSECTSRVALGTDFLAGVGVNGGSFRIPATPLGSTLPVRGAGVPLNFDEFDAEGTTKNEGEVAVADVGSNSV